MEPRESRTTRPYDTLGAAGSETSTGRGGMLAGFGCSISLLFCAAGAAAARDNVKPENADKAIFCSELVARVFELAGAPLVEGAASAVTPPHSHGADPHEGRHARGHPAIASAGARDGVRLCDVDVQGRQRWHPQRARSSFPPLTGWTARART